MKNLIEALTIFLKYRDEKWPTFCGVDQLCIAGVTKDEVSEEDAKRLYELDFTWSETDGCWHSFRYGSA